MNTITIRKLIIDVAMSIIYMKLLNANDQLINLIPFQSTVRYSETIRHKFPCESNYIPTATPGVKMVAGS